MTDKLTDEQVAALARCSERAHDERNGPDLEDGDGNTVTEWQVTALAEEVQALRAVLRAIQWGAPKGRGPFGCPDCGMYEPEGHTPDCAVGAALVATEAR
jgi:hypothetical protein